MGPGLIPGVGPEPPVSASKSTHVGQHIRVFRCLYNQEGPRALDLSPESWQMLRRYDMI